MQALPRITPHPFIYVRHGQTQWNLENRTQGSADIPLNALGREQAAMSAERLKASGRAISRIYCSPLMRAQETAHTIGVALGLPVTTLGMLREASFGEQEGKDRGDWLNAWRHGSTPLGAESYRSLLQRVAAGLNHALDGSPEVLIVAHLAVYWAVEEALGHAPGPETANGLPLLHLPPASAAGAWCISPL